MTRLLISFHVKNPRVMVYALAQYFTTFVNYWAIMEKCTRRTLFFISKKQVEAGKFPCQTAGFGAPPLRRTLNGERQRNNLQTRMARRF